VLKILIVPLLLMASVARSVGPEDVNALVEAVQRGDKSEVKKLIKSGVDVNGKNINGITALHAVAGYPPKENVLTIIKILLKAGANVGVRNQEGKKPLDEVEDCLRYDVPYGPANYGTTYKEIIKLLHRR
jgi:ankyrin repeat protein